MSLLSKKQKKIHSGIRKKGYLGGFSIMAHLFHWCRSPPRGQSHSQLDRVWKGSHPSHLHLGLFLVLPHPQMHDIPIDTRGKKIRWRWIIRVYQSTQPLFMGRALYQLSYCGTLNVQNILIQLKKGISLINKKYFKNVFETKLKRCATLFTDFKGKKLKCFYMPCEHFSPDEATRADCTIPNSTEQSATSTTSWKCIML